MQYEDVGGVSVWSRHSKIRSIVEGTIFVILFVIFLICIVAVVVVSYIIYLQSHKIQIPSLIIYNATIWTGDEDMEFAESVVVVNGVIEDVGSTVDILNKYYFVFEDLGQNQTTIVNGNGSLFVTPGFVDSHIHLLVGGHNLRGVKLRDVTSRNEFIERVREYASKKPNGTWIIGGEWNEHQFGDTLPNKTWVDGFTSDNPLYLIRADGHIALCNSRCLEIANITKDTPDIPGGEIQRDENGNPTGILRDNALPLVYTKIKYTDDENDEAMDLAMAYVNQFGVTQVHAMDAFRHFGVYNRTAIENRLKIRIYASVELSEWKKLSDLVKATGRGNDWFSYGILKGFVDGSLGAHTALQFEPYVDSPSDYGLWVTPEEDLLEWGRNADKENLQLAMHAIGDKANNAILNIFENITARNGPRDRRFRVEHAQQLLDSDRPRFSAMNVIASIQPVHMIDDIPWAEEVLGPKRIYDLYIVNGITKHGANITLGSDWFVYRPNPLECIYSAVTRITSNYPNGFNKNETISVREALKAFTSNAAYASFKEDRLGKLKKRYLADITILDHNLFELEKTDKKAIRDVKALYTIVGGNIVFKR